MKNNIVGHEFLAKLGKKRLRPGGVRGTDYLIEHIKSLKKDNLKILEISCNRGYSLINIARSINCDLVGIDINPEVVKIAEENIKANKLQDKVKVYQMNAMNMDFNGLKFDVIINEAMLTMYQNKNQFLDSYKKHLNKGGIILTHDICLKNRSKDYGSELKEIINLKPYPLELDDWIKTFANSNLNVIDYKMFKFSLVSIGGLIRDEGLFNMIKIMKNALKKENKEDFMAMKRFFKKNKKNMEAICFVIKGEENE